MTHQLSISDLEYELPENRIATHPVKPRSSAKLLVVDKDAFVDCNVSDLPHYLPSNALLVVNETSVLPARFMTIRVDSGGKVEGLFLEEIEGDWVVMLKSNGKLRAGIELELSTGVQLTLVEKIQSHWKCLCSDSSPACDVLKEAGSTPIPPYIVRARGEEIVSDEIDRVQYQTIFADSQQCKSVAAPTAGLHFDASLLAELEGRGIQQVAVTLHVGAGTFKEIETETIAEHVMHVEQWSVSQHALDAIREAKVAGRSIVAVGTTTVRTLESLPDLETWPSKGGLLGSTDLMIAPPYTFKLVDGMLTNFHLPKSTLLTLVAAKIGIQRMRAAYEHAIASGYRFYSFGDAMFLPP